MAVEFEDYVPGENQGEDDITNGGDEWTLSENIDNVWEATEEAPPELVPGTYEVVVNKVEKKTAKTGSRGLNWHMTVVDGKYKGRKCFTTQYLMIVVRDSSGEPTYSDDGSPVLVVNAKGFPYIKRDFSLCQIPLEAPLMESILEALPQLPGILLKVSIVKQRTGDGTNLYFKEYMGRMEV